MEVIRVASETDEIRSVNTEHLCGQKHTSWVMLRNKIYKNSLF